MSQASEDLQTKILDACTQLGQANHDLALSCRELAEAEHQYRRARAIADLEARTQGSEKKTETHLKSIVDRMCDKEMLRVRLAEADREATLQLVLSLRTQISALQSLIRNEIETAAAVRYGQTVGA